MNYDNFQQRDPDSDPNRSKVVFYFNPELSDRLKRRQAQLEALGMSTGLDYMLDAACAFWCERFTHDDFLAWVNEQVTRQAPGWEEMPDLSDPDELLNCRTEHAFTKYLDHLESVDRD